MKRVNYQRQLLYNSCLCNYTPYLLDMAAAVWVMKHIKTHLVGKHFVLSTGHKPLETLGKVHTKTYNHRQ